MGIKQIFGGGNGQTLLTAERGEIKIGKIRSRGGEQSGAEALKSFLFCHGGGIFAPKLRFSCQKNNLMLHFLHFGTADFSFFYDDLIFFNNLWLFFTTCRYFFEPLLSHTFAENRSRHG